MGSVTIQVIGDASVGTKSKTYNFSDADINRLVAYCRSAYPDANGAQASIVNGLVRWADGLIEGTKTNVQRFETAQPTVPAKIVST